MKKTKKIIAVLIAVMMVSVFLPASTAMADVAVIKDKPFLTPSTISVLGAVVSYAGQQWYIMGNDTSGGWRGAPANSITLLHKNDFNNGNGVDVYGSECFGQMADDIYYEGSLLRSAINSIEGTFPAKEVSKINPRTLIATTDDFVGNDVENQILWAPSYNEITNLNTIAKSYWDIWWTRSYHEIVGGVATNANCAYQRGGGGAAYRSANNIHAIRPAFSLNLSSVLFSSEAQGTSSKSSALVGDGVVAAKTITSGAPFKFTMQDASQALDVVATVAQAEQSGVSSVALSYTDATLGSKQYVSCVLVNSSDAVAYYGKLADSSTDANGSISIPLADVSDGTYTLKIFSEEANGDNYTDFCSEPVTMTLDVVNGKGAISNFGGTITNNEPQTTVTSVAINPDSVSVEKGNTVQFAAIVTGTNNPAQTVTWSLDGTYASGTKIDSSGLLAIATVETAPTLTVKATSTLDNTKSGTATVTITSPSSTPDTFSLTVVEGTDNAGASPYTEGTDISITANVAPKGQIFDKWSTNGGGTFANATNETTTFTMPANNVTVTATYKANLSVENPPGTNIPVDLGKDLTITFNGEYANIATLKLDGNLLRIVPTSSTSGDIVDYPDYAKASGNINSGSVIVTLHKEFLQWLPNGIYDLEVAFNDGNTVVPVSVGFLISNADTPATASTTGGSTSSTKTGDDTPVGLMIALIVVAGAGLAVLFIRQRFVKN